MARPLPILAALAMLALTLPGQAEIYKWVDENGKVHFTDTPPPKQQTEKVRIQPAPTPPPQGAIASYPVQPDGDGTNDRSDNRALCEKALRNARRYFPTWERLVRSRFPEMTAEEREKAEADMTAAKVEMAKASRSLNKCADEMENAENRMQAECLANADNAMSAAFCIS